MTPRKKLDLGNSDFKNTIQAKAYYIDKSLFIQEVVEAESSVLLFPRPRRFGKTLNLSMLKYFFDKTETDAQNLFEDLLIWKADNASKDHYRRYPVISLSFKDAKANHWEDCQELIVAELVKAYRQHRYLLEGDTLFDDEKQEFLSIINKTAKTTDYQNSLKMLSGYLRRFHRQHVLILMDEYDTPIQAGFGKYYEEVVSFMRNLLSGAFKDNLNLYKGIISGILRISKESIFSGLNNLSAYSLLDHRFSDHFGFTEKEVEKILRDFELEEQYQQVKKWYNGYKFGNTESIYNPWSILNFALNPKDGFKPYWTNTSSNELIKNQIKKKNANATRQELIKLINGQSIVKEIEENFVFSDWDSPKEMLWTLLVYAGYLTVRNNVSRKEYELRIPNYEVKTVFQDTIIEWLQTEVKINKSSLAEMANALVANRPTEFEKAFRQVMGDTFSYFDTQKGNEYVFHAYVLGLLALLGDEYIVRSNRESGEGRYDILMIPHDKSRYGVVIEIKTIDKQKPHESGTSFHQRVQAELAEALEQIERNRYHAELLSHKIAPERILKLPIVFAGKQPFVAKA